MSYRRPYYGVGVTLAIPATWELITNPDVQDSLLTLTESVKVSELVIMFNKLSNKRADDSAQKDALYNNMPKWMHKHIVWPVGQERYSDVLFMWRIFNALEVDDFWASRESDIKNANSAIFVNRSPLKTIAKRIMTLDSVEVEKNKYWPRKQYMPLESALKKVL